MYKKSDKQKARREQFRKIGQAITAITGDPDTPDYHTGRESQFKIRNGRTKWLARFDEQGRILELFKAETWGPANKTPQWRRAVERTYKSTTDGQANA